MRILADENVPGPVVHALRERGYDVVWIAENLASTADPDVLALAQDQARLLITFDTDFGALAFSAGQPA
jgi:predicted nuclease of predicted toxin-antitoxin system